MSGDPTYEDTLPFRVTAIRHLEVIAGIDRGGSLTKIVFLPKAASLDDAEYAPLRCLTFANSNFEDALLTMKSQAQLPASGELHCSGVGCANFKGRIKEVLGLDILFVPEQVCALRGTYLTLLNIKSEDIMFPTPPFKTWTFESDYLNEAFKGRFEDKHQDAAFPAGIMQIGSGSAVGIIDASGKSKYVGLTAHAGKSFMGLARMLLGTTNYDEITALAAKGNRCKLDYQVRDMLVSDGPEYGQFPPSMPVFSFGKASLDTWHEEDVSKADKAASLVAFFAGGILMMMLYVSRMTGVKRFYVAGNFARAEIVRSVMMESVSLLRGDIDVQFLITGHTGAIGAMMSTAEDTVKKWIVREIDL